MLTLRFEDFEDRDDKKFIYYFVNKKNQSKKFTISNDLYEQVIKFRELKISQDTNYVKAFIIPTGKSIKAHFIFDLTRFKLQKKISRKFAKVITGLKSILKDI